MSVDLLEAIGVATGSGRGQGGLVAWHSASRIESSEPRGGRPIAVVSCMPPAESGIADSTLLTFREASYAVDIFSAYPSPDEYLHALTDRRLQGSNLRVFDTSSLPLGLRRGLYRAQIFVLGNSDHNLRIALAMRLMRHFRPGIPTYVYLHDPDLRNILKRVAEVEQTPLAQWLKNAYPDRDGAGIEGPGAPEPYGVRALLQDVPVDGIIVNSLSAKELVLRDYPEFGRERVSVLFHPVFAAAPRAVSTQPSGLVFGSFGVPSPAKRTEIVTAAFRLLRSRFAAARLIIAGYDAGRYAEQCGLGSEQGFDVHDSPSPDSLQQLMASCRVAVQLRRANMGESSGVVAQLLGLGKPIIVSRIGAFREYADAVAFVSTSISAEALADAMAAEAGRPHARSATIAAYAASHRPSVFCERLDLLIRFAD